MADSPNEGKGVIKCADCLHCKQFREVNEATGQYLLKVKCARGHWQVGRKHGHCDLHRIMAKRKHKCPDYSSMSGSDNDRREYLKGLSATLPLERVIYEPNGEPADILEALQW